jgi:hypothetical protein
VAGNTPTSNVNPIFGAAAAAAGVNSPIGNEIAAQLASNVYENTKTRARGMIDLYANIDIIRPYFDVYPSHVLHRYGSAWWWRWRCSK